MTSHRHEHVYLQKSGMSKLITCSKSKKHVTCSLIILSQWFFVTLDSLYKLWTLCAPLSSADAILEIPENQWKTFLCADVVISNLFCDRAGYICSTNYHGDVSINRTTMHTENKGV